MSGRLTRGLWVILLLSTIPVPSQEAATAQPAYRLLSTDSLEDLQQALDDASANGYAPAFGSPAYQLLVLRRRADSEEPSAYRVLDGPKAIEQAMAQGLRAIPGTFDTAGGTLVAIARRASETERHELLVLQTNRTGTLNDEMASDDAGHSALLERPANVTPEAGSVDPGALVAANTQDTLQQELAARAEAGYHIVQASAWKEMLLALERREGQEPTEYRVLSTTRSGTLGREVNAAASQGFRYVPGTLHAVQKGATLFGRAGSEFVAIMERAPSGDAAREYFLVGARRVSTLTREFDEAVTGGFAPVGLTLGYQEQENLILLDRSRR